MSNTEFVQPVKQHPDEHAAAAASAQANKSPLVYSISKYKREGAQNPTGSSVYAPKDVPEKSPGRNEKYFKHPVLERKDEIIRLLHEAANAPPETLAEGVGLSYEDAVDMQNLVIRQNVGELILMGRLSGKQTITITEIRDIPMPAEATANLS